MALKPFNSVGGFSVGEIPANVILANSDIFTNNFTVNTFANLGNVGNVYIGGGSSGAVLSTDGTGNLSWSSSPGVTEIQNGNSNVSIPTANGNIYINANNGADYQWVFDNTGILTLANSGGYSIIASPSGSNVDIYTGGSQYTELFMIDGGNIQLNTAGGNYSWVFSNTGNLTVPGSSYITPVTGSLNLTDASGNSYIDIDTNNIYLYTDYEGSEYEWNLDNTGNTTFPATGTANLGNLVTANYANFANDVAITGNANVTGNVTASNFSTTGSAGNISGANVIFANSFTSNGGTVDFNTNNANVLLGNIANVHIYGGSNGQALITDGTGNLSWTSTANVSEIYNGNSNVTIPTTDGNVYINANSGTDQQWVFDTNGLLTLATPTGGYSQITSNSGSNIDIYTGGANYSEIYLIDGGNVTIATNGELQNWTFDQNGQLTLPNGSSITGQPNTAINIYTNSGVYSGIQLNDNGTNSNVRLYSQEGAYNWIFEDNGNLILPNAASGYATITTPAANNISIQTGGAQYSQVILNDGGDVIIYGNAQNAEYVFGANGTFSVGSGTTIDFNTNNANVLLGNIANVHIYGGSNNQVLTTDGNGNLSWSSGSQIANGASNVTIPTGNGNVYINANAGTDYQWTFDTTGNTTFPAIGVANLGNLVTANYANFANDLYAGGNGNIQGNLEVAGNITTGGGSGGNISGVDYLFADYANITYDVNAGNTVTANYFYANYDANIAGNLYVQNNATITGNLSAGNITGALANGTSNVSIPSANGNVIISVNGTANVLTVSNVNVTIAGNTITSGNVISNATFIGNTITSVGTYLTIASDQSSNGTYNINLVPGGAGNVDVHSTNITSLADPVNPQDAATKQYVDNISQGLYVHPAANVLSSSNLNATYNNGGTSLTVTDIIGNSVVQFSGAHGLSVGNTISFTNSFNGISGDPDVYYVASVPASNQITLKDEYYGPAPVETLTAGTGLSQPALGQAGTGATLTNAGTLAALIVDSVTTTTGLRVLVTGQTNQAYNGIYDVTTVGDGSTPWVLTRSTDGSSYIPQSANGLAAGSYFFVTEGSVYGGSSWIVTTTGEIDIGITNITFVQFSQGGAYTGANGINVTGTLITANVDGVTTDIVGGNIVVKTSANLTTPNVGDATFSSLSWNTLSNGNINVSNVNASNTTLTNVLSVNTSATANTITSNAWANIGTDLIVGGNANITGNVQVGTGSGGNITGVNVITANTANVGDVNATGNVNALTGNITANAFYGNSIDINNGGPANITGNLTANYIFANYDANISGNANVTSTLFVGNSSSNVSINNGNANLTGNILVGNVSSNVAITNDGNVTASANLNANNANISNVIALGNTQVNWGTVTTTNITANQTIAQIPTTGINGIEFFVKGIDATGTKYSVATVQAVTDGSNVDYVVYGGAYLTASTGTLAVNIVGGNVALQVTPSSSNSTVWTTQYKTV